MADTNKKIITVALGVAINTKGQVLLTKRNDPENPENHEKWELPGGGVENDEEPIEAVHREILEEIGVTCHVVSHRPVVKLVKHKFENVLLLSYPITIDNQTIVLQDEEVLDYQWIEPEKVADLDFLPFLNEIVEEVYQAYLQESK